MSVYVVDASVALKWYVPEVHSEDALRLLEPGNELHAPDLLHAEAGTILRKKTRGGELTSVEAHRIAHALLAVPLTMHATSGLLEGAIDIAAGTDRTVYDALHVALAVAMGVVLVTADRRLVNALGKTPFGRHVSWVEDTPR